MNQAVRAPALQLAQRSLAGARAENQDACGARVPSGTALARKGIAVAVADGVSAAESGRIAAETGVQNFLGDYYATPDEWGVRRAGGQVLDALNRWLLGQGVRVRDARRGYVTTFTGGIFLGRQLHLFHVGDSRVYRLRGGRLEPLTRDHRVLVDDGRPVLSRALGLDNSLDIDYAAWPLETGDVYAFMTDGVHDFTGEDAIRNALALDGDPETLCRALLDTAAAAGSDDNLTCLVVRVNELPDIAIDDLVDTWDALRLPPLLSPGQTLDGLRVEKVLAESPRSQVYRVRNTVTQTACILKTPSPRCEDIDAVRREYATETWVLRRIRHPRLPRVAEPPQPRSALYVLTEPVEGQSLRSWMRRFPQAPVTEATQIARQIAAALRALHRRDIVHRDVRPENVLLDGNGQATLIDLGQCRVAGLAALQPDSQPGALEYAAPEHTLNPRAAGERSDQFALAAMLYEMLTGQLPFDGRLADAHRRQQFGKLAHRPADDINPLVPPWLDDVLARALDMDPSRRYGDVAEFEDALVRPLTSARRARKPLLLRNPLRVWQGATLLLLVTQLVTLAWLLLR